MLNIIEHFIDDLDQYYKYYVSITNSISYKTTEKNKIHSEAFLAKIFEIFEKSCTANVNLSCL